MLFIGMGDSLMQFNDYSTYPQTGWFQVLDRFVNDPKEHTFLDFALNGRSTKSFIDEGQYQKALDAVKKDAVVFISFGHNDEKYLDPKRYCPAFSTYKENLKRFCLEVRKKGGIPILLSSIERVKYDEKGNLCYTHKDYVKAIKEVSEENKVDFIDLNKLSHDFYQSHSFEENKRYIMFFKKGSYPNYTEDKEDTTHLTMDGAMNICNLILPELKKLAYLQFVFK